MYGITVTTDKIKLKTIKRINTIINLESLVHSMITLNDGSVIKGIDKVSMENPIRRALYYPEIRYTKELHNENEFHFREK